MIKNKYRIQFFCAILFCFGVLLLSFCVSNNRNVLFVGTMFLCVAVLLRSGISVFSVMAVIITYIALPVYMQDNYGKTYGVLEISELPLYAREIYIYLSVYLFLLFSFVTFTRILKREKELYQRHYYISDKILWLFCAGAILFAIVSFPRIPFVHSSRDRFDMLLPGSSWNYLTLVFLIAITCRYKDSWLARITGIFVCIWFVGNGERVDILGYVIGCLLFYLNRHKISKGSYVVLFLGIVACVILLNVVGNIRSGVETTFSSIFYDLVVQKTATDLAYVFNCCIHFSKTKLLFGATYGYYLINFFPLVNAENKVLSILDTFHSPGGEFLLCEPLLNFGWLGILFVTCLEFFILYLLFNSKTKYFQYILLLIIFNQFRVLWYGRSYVEMSIVYFIPALMFVKYILERYFSRLQLSKHSAKTNF